MARVKAPLMSIGAQKQLGKALIYKQKGSRSFVTGYNKPGGQNPSPASPSQLDQRMLYNLIVARWQTFSDVEKAVWNDDPRKKSLGISGWNLFLREALRDLPTHLGLVGYWSFNKIVSGKILDLSGNENDGVLKPDYPTDAPQLINSIGPKFGKAGSFDGVNDYIHIGNPTILQNMNEGTIETWVKRQEGSTTYQMVISDNYSSLEIAWIVNTIRFYLSNSAVVVSLPTLNVWYHVVGTWSISSNFQRMYINSVLAGSKAPAGNTGSKLRYIGSRKGALGLKGVIDELRIYNRVLSLAEIQKHYKTITKQ